MTVMVSQEPNKRHVQSHEHEGAPRSKCQCRSGKPKGDRKE